jgi:oligopeptide transport system permease protein
MIKTSQKNRSPTENLKETLTVLFTNKLALFGFCFLSLQIMLAVFAPFLSSHSFEETNLLLGASPPSTDHLLGTDDLGRDLFVRILYGSRVSLLVGFLATLVSVIIGVIYGGISGYVGGKTDLIMMRFVEVLYSLPFTFLVIMLMVLFGRNIYFLFLALGAVQWLTMARIVRGQVMSLLNQSFVQAAQVTGASHARILFQHILPNTTGPIIVYATLLVPAVVLEEAFLSFLGLGVQEPMASWGTLIQNGVGAMEVYPWMLVFPSVSLVVTLMALNFIGDGLGQAINPHALKR